MSTLATVSVPPKSVSFPVTEEEPATAPSVSVPPVIESSAPTVIVPTEVVPPE